MKVNNKEKVKKVGLRRVIRNALWVLFVAAFAFAVYKNFTAIDQHTIHEREVVEQVVVDTSGVKSFVRNFASDYYNWGNTSDAIAARQTALEQYMTSELVQLNANAIMESGGSTASMTDFKVWELLQVDDSNFQVVYTVQQRISLTVTDTVTEYAAEPEIKEVVNEETGEVTYEESIVQKEVQKEVESTEEKSIESCYMVIVQIDEPGNMVIIKNPTISSIPVKSDYHPDIEISDSSVDFDTTNEIKAFLKKFFSLYPAADQAELAYYVKNNALAPVEASYAFVELSDFVCKDVDGQIIVSVTVKYYDESTGINQFSQFELGLDKADNWVIVSNDIST